jgi:phage shock protein C
MTDSTSAPDRPHPRLYRSRDDRMIGGVAGGLAKYLGADSALVRLAFVAVALAGVGILAYVVAWIVIPEEPPATVGAERPAGATGASQLPAAGAGPAAAGSQKRGDTGGRLLLGASLVLIGTMLLVDRVVPDLHRFFWPGAIIVIGLGLLAYGARR